MPAVGALAGSIFVSVRPLPSRQGRIFLVSVAAYGAATVVFGFSRSFVLTMAALAAIGLADAISTVIRQTLRQLVTPDRLRGRMTSVNAIFFLGGPQLGELEAGLVASLFASAAVGVTVSVVSGGLATLAIAAFVAAVAPALRRYDTPEPRNESTQRRPISPVPRPPSPSPPVPQSPSPSLDRKIGNSQSTAVLLWENRHCAPSTSTDLT
jgi:MFS family permease